MSVHRSLHALSAALFLAGCAAPPPAPAVPAGSAAEARAIEPPARLLPWPAVAARAYAVTEGGAPLSGTVAFSAVSDPYFADSAAYRLAALPTANAFVTLANLQGETFVAQGQVIRALSRPDGSFELGARAPVGAPFEVRADLLASHRLSALVLPGQAHVSLDEASSMVAETARFQLRPAPRAEGEPSFRSLTPERLARLSALTRELLVPEDFATTGAVPSVPLLKLSDGLLLRNQYVKRFGAAIARDGAQSADALSDAWQAVLGFRPLALTRVAGSGTLEPSAGDHVSAIATALVRPQDAQRDAGGNLWIVEGGGRLRYVPESDTAPLFARTAAMQPGCAYTVAGISPELATLDGQNATWQALLAAVRDPLAAPAVAGAPLIAPSRLEIEQDGAARHVYLASAAGVIYFLPGADLSRYGRTFLAGRLYTLAGMGPLASPLVTDQLIEADDPDTPNFNETRPRYTVYDGDALGILMQPSSFARDRHHGLYILESGINQLDTKDPDPAATYSKPVDLPGAKPGRYMNYYHGAVRYVRPSDGRIFTLRLTHGGAPYALEGASDLRILETGEATWLYLADTRRHAVVRVRLPADTSQLVTDRPGGGYALPGPLEVEVVLGRLDTPGWIADEGLVPDLYSLNDGLLEDQVLLTAPQSLAFDHEGNLIVADRGRVRLLEAAGLAGDGRVFTLAGGLESSLIEGDARLASFPGTRHLHFDPLGRNLLLADSALNLVRQLWTARGAR